MHPYVRKEVCIIQNAVGDKHQANEIIVISSEEDGEDELFPNGEEGRSK